MNLPEAMPASPYPDTRFVENFASDQEEARVLRGVCVAEYFSGGNEWMIDGFAMLAALDRFEWPEAASVRLPTTLNSLEVAFDGGMAPALAAAGLGDRSNSDAVAAKAARLTQAWEAMHQSMPQTIDESEREIAQPKERLGVRGLVRHTRNIDNLAHTMLYVDWKALGSNPPSYQPQPVGESIFREVVLGARSTRVKFIDRCCGQMYELSSGVHAYSRPLTLVKREWEQRNPNENFYPAEYLKDRKAVPLRYKVPGQIGRILSSFYWWPDYADFLAAEHAYSQGSM